MKVGSLCSGYGGLDLALGLPVAWHVEHDAAPSKILAARFPGVPNYGDLTAVNWAELEPVDVLTAGYPCQPFSQAGKRQGKNDDRHLWPYVADAVRVLRPGVVYLENVAGHLTLGFGDVLGDLARLGYNARWCCVRASDIGAPHQRKRLFVFATGIPGMGRGTYLAGAPGEPANTDDGRRFEHDTGFGRVPEFGAGSSQPATDARGAGAGWHAGAVSGEVQGRAGLDVRAAGDDRGVAWGDYEPAIRRWEHLTRAAPAPVDDRGRLAPVFVEWMMGLPAGWVTDIDIPRTAQLKALGNGVVPQQAAHAWRLLTSTHLRSQAA